MNDDSMIYIDNRINTFKYPVAIDGKKYTWNDIIDFHDNKELVEAGFYYSPIKRTTNRITCAYCQKSTTVKKNSSVKEIVSDHSKCSIRCPMACLLNLYNSCCGLLDDEIKKCWAKSKFRDPFNQDSVKLRANFFKNFPLDDTDYRPNSKSLSEAGFIYSPRYFGDDRVVCAYCHCALDSWDQQDDPIEEHLSNNSSYCYFLDKYVERKQGESKHAEKSLFDESLHLDEYDYDIARGDIEENREEPPLTKQDADRGNDSKPKQSFHERTYVKEDPNLKYWKKLPDEDLLQEFIQVSKHANGETGAGAVETKSTNAHIINDKQDDRSEGGNVGDKNGGGTPGAGNLPDIDNGEKDFGHPDSNNEMPMDDINSIEMVEPDQKDSIVKSSNESAHKEDEDSIDSNSNDDYDPTSDSFEPSNDRDESIIEFKPKKTKKETLQEDRIEKKFMLQPDEPKKRSGESLSPTRRKKMIKRTTAVPVFEDSSIDQDYDEAHIAKLEKNIVKQSMFLPMEDKSFEQPEVFTSPMRMSPTKLPESAKKTDSIKPSIFDSSCDITNEDLRKSKLAEVYSVNGRKEDSKVSSDETNSLGSMNSKDKKASVHDTHTDVRPEVEANAITKDEPHRTNQVQLEIKTIQASNTVNNSLTDVKLMNGNDNSLEGVDNLGAEADVKDEEFMTEKVQKSSFSRESFIQQQAKGPKNSHVSHENKIIEHEFIGGNVFQRSVTHPESLHDNDSESDYSDYLNEINEMDKHFEIEDNVKEKTIKAESKQADTSSLEQDTGDASGQLNWEQSSKNVANILGSPDKVLIKSVKEESQQINETTKPSSIETLEVNKMLRSNTGTSQPHDGSLSDHHLDVNALERILTPELDHSSADAKTSTEKAPSTDALNESKLVINDFMHETRKESTRVISANDQLSESEGTNDTSNSTGPLAMDSFLNDENDNAAEGTQSIAALEWEAKSMQQFVQQMQDLDNSSKELKMLAGSKYDLHNDLDGDLTRFIAEMPEEEEQMTIEQWLEHCAINCKDIVAQSMKEMNQYILDEYDRAIKTLESLEES
ncbi:hypothetical protein CORT_0D03470 [Candida orthopsilosis Co 90-125]|uniref:Uncharacterized protein n=1 Tax=Candida orthopsilosis (strain 90-125) TaxID=1136231 RepID=H8X596_CANO9|nr:hypothetical protein CORT_0D03470 [Candida orthopsilosis Co 90-125]CCG23189.1 hypothetical protein CORT_0D03470 [Candida orthopsilosis Co 90-125]